MSVSTLPDSEESSLFLPHKTPPQTPYFQNLLMKEKPELAQTPLKNRAILMLKKTFPDETGASSPITPLTIEDLTPICEEDKVDFFSKTFPDPTSNQGYSLASQILEDINLKISDFNAMVSFIHEKASASLHTYSITFSKHYTSLPRTLSILNNLKETCHSIIYDCPKKNKLGLDGSFKSIKINALFVTYNKITDRWFLKRVITFNIKNHYGKKIKNLKEKAQTNCLHKSFFLNQGCILINKIAEDGQEHVTFMQDWKGDSLKEKGKFNNLFFSLNSNQRKNLLINHIKEIKSEFDDEGKVVVRHDRKWSNVLLNKNKTKLISIDDMDSGTFTYSSPNILFVSKTGFEWELKTSILGYSLMMAEALYPTKIHLLNYLQIDFYIKKSLKSANLSKDPLEFLKTEYVEDSLNRALNLGLAEIIEKSIKGEIENYEELYQHFIGLPCFEQ